MADIRDLTLGAMVGSRRLRKFVGLSSVVLTAIGAPWWVLGPPHGGGGAYLTLIGVAGLIYWVSAWVLAIIARVVAEDVKRDYLDEPAQSSADLTADEVRPQTETGSGDERRDYELAERVGTREAWQSFLTAHGAGFFADLARSQLGKLANVKP